jgi:PTS system mannose-specific IIA component
MIGVVVVTHGQLATELLNAAETIVGDLPRFAAVSIGWHDDTGDARGRDRAGDRACRGGGRSLDSE